MAACWRQVCTSTALFGFVSEIDHEQFFTAACLILRAIMGAHLPDRQAFYGCPQGLLLELHMLLLLCVSKQLHTCCKALKEYASTASTQLLIGPWRLRNFVGMAGLGCAAVDTASMALSASLYGGTPFLGTAMGIQV